MKILTDTMTEFTRTAGRFVGHHSQGCRAVARTAVAGLGLVWAGSLHAQIVTLNCPNGFGPVVMPVAPAALMTSLKTVPNPVIPKAPLTGAPVLRDDLVAYVANLQAAIQLGKALFWDVQAGSDDKTACATCHFQAGADVRWRNQIEPGANKAWLPKGPNTSLASTDYPFTDIFASPVKDTDNTAGSQGVRKSVFTAINAKTGAETTASIADTVFNVGGLNVRQVTGKNAPSVINSVFNHRQFHNGRSQPEFNGVNILGYRDPVAQVWQLGLVGGTPSPIQIKIANASLASQAVGPALNSTEMSAAGRTFQDLGRKLLLKKPLGLQKVSATDSVLGPVAATGTALGLSTTYTALIQQAFQPKWWNTKKTVTVGGKSYTMMEANFSLFWGVAIMLYEATLVSDDSPMDRYLSSRVFSLAADGTLLATSDPSLLDPLIQRLTAEGIPVTRESLLNGLALFELPVAPPPSFPVPTGANGAPLAGVGCIACHVGAETTSASIRNLTGPGVEPGDVVFKNAGFDLRMERMFKLQNWAPTGPLTPVPQGTDSILLDASTYSVWVLDINGSLVSPALPIPVVTYDSGWYNLGVRPTTDDIGLGGLDPSGLPLSWTEYLQKTISNPSVIKVPGGGLASSCVPPSAPLGTPFATEVLNPLTGLPILAGGLLKTEATDVAGTFKTLALRNVELTGPYFHNGGKLTLNQVLEFYDHGGDFENPTKSPLLVPLMLSADQTTSLVSFLVSLTDDRVRLQKAPFDHPQIFVPNGAPDTAPATDTLVEVPAVGAAGSAPLGRFLEVSPFAP